MSNLKVTRRFASAFVVAVALFFGWNIDAAHARSGKAAYHLHTSSMVTAARYEPRGSILLVTNPENGKSVTVTVNDRGPFNGNRILDLSTGAFTQLYGGLRRGVGPVTYKVIRSGYGEQLSARKGGYRGNSKRGQSKYSKTRNRKN